jgi:hypothetical protein
MIISKSIVTNINNMNKEHYRSLGYDVSNKKITIIVEDLPRNSTMKIDVTCDYCGDVKNVYYKSYVDSVENGGNYACRKCFSIKFKETCIKKYGVENPSMLENVKHKKKNTYLKNYGVDHFSKTDEYQEKKSTTMLERYGVKHALQSEKFKTKFKETSLSRYGVDHPFMDGHIIDKIKLTNLEKYGVENIFSSDSFKDELKKNNLEKYGFEYYVSTDEFKKKSKDTCKDKYNNEFYCCSEEFINTTKIGNDDRHIKYLGNSIHLFNCDNGKDHTFEINIDNYYNRIKNNTPLCTVCNPIGDLSSIKEKQLLEFLKSVYSGEIIHSYRDGLEIDIYLPDLNLGFEFNGLYWHSEEYRDKDYHLNKTNYFKNKSIRLFHIWEDDWSFNRLIVESQIKSLLGVNEKIFARKCVVKELNNVSDFLNTNHIQGVDRSVKKIGLIYNGELVSVMTFNKLEGRKKMNDGEYNLSRFCNKLNTNVVGGASKLLSYFETNNDVKKIISYADKDWSIGNLYYILGFEKVYETKPDYKYIIGQVRKHKQNFKKSNLKLSENITESSYMKKKGYNKIFDCGKIKFQKLSIENYL